MNFDWLSLGVAMPEIFLSLMALVLLMVGAFSEKIKATKAVSMLTVWSIVGAFGLMMLTWQKGKALFAFPINEAGGYMYIADDFAIFTKGLILFVSLVVLGISKDYLKRTKLYRYEYYILYLLSVVGMMLMVSAYNFLTVYVGLELMSFVIYILAAFKRDDLKSSESGLKYYIMGALSSCMLLYGISLLYGATGDISFANIQYLLSSGAVEHSIMISIAMVLILVGVAFKIAAVPFHMWTPDVYEGAPTSVTVFMAVAPKVAAFALILRVMYIPMESLLVQWNQILIILAVLTMGIGSLMAIMQDNIKRLLAFSSIAHVGFVLVGIVAGTEAGVSSALFYLAIYTLMTMGAFGVILALQRRGKYMETISDMAGLSKTAPIMAFMMMIFMFSLAGVPPLAGFFAKLYVFSAAIESGLFSLVVLAVIFSAIAAYYSLRIVKAMYFEDSKFETLYEVSNNTRFATALMALLVFIFGIFPHKIIDVATVAATSLF